MDTKDIAAKNEISPPKTAKCMDVIRIIVGIFTIVMSSTALFDGIQLGSQGYPFYAVTMIACFALLFIGGIVMIACYKNHTLGVSIACTIMFSIGTIIILACGWRIDTGIALIGMFFLSSRVSDGSFLIIFPILLIFSVTGIVLSATKKVKYFVVIPVLLLLVFVGYIVLDSQSIPRDGDVFDGEARIGDVRYVSCGFESTGRKRIIAKIDHWGAYEMMEDPSQTFIKLKSFTSEEYLVREDYKIPTKGKVNCIYIEDRRLTDEKTRNAFNEILATDFDEGTPYTLTHDADDPLKWHIVVLGFEDCPVGTDYSIYGICRIGSRWAVIFRNEIGESEDGNSPTVYHELDPKYNEVFDKFINW